MTGAELLFVILAAVAVVAVVAWFLFQRSNPESAASHDEGPALCRLATSIQPDRVPKPTVWPAPENPFPGRAAGHRPLTRRNSAMPSPGATSAPRTQWHRHDAVPRPMQAATRWSARPRSWHRSGTATPARRRLWLRTCWRSRAKAWSTARCSRSAIKPLACLMMMRLVRTWLNRVASPAPERQASPRHRRSPRVRRR